MSKREVSKSTVIDLAEYAKVSVGTVSRVLNGYQNVSTDNVERVQKAIEQLGYQRKASGPSPSRRDASRTRNLAVVFSGMEEGWANHPLVGNHSMGVERACREHDFHALIEFSADGKVMPRCISDNKVDALLLKATRQLPDFVKRLPSDFPVVCVGMDDPLSAIPQVAADNHGSGWIAAEHLWRQGHRRIAFACTDVIHPMFLSRFHGYESFMRMRRSFDFSLCWLREARHNTHSPELDPPDMSSAVDSLMSQQTPPTAIIAANDWMAMGLYAALKEKGLSIPEDVSIISFDNIGVVCASLRPQLTSITIPLEEMSYVATLKAIERLRNPAQLSGNSLHLIRGNIVERASIQSIAEESDYVPISDHSKRHFLEQTVS